MKQTNEGRRMGRVPLAAPRSAELHSALEFGHSSHKSQRDSASKPRVADSSRLPWVRGRNIFNPERVASLGCERRCVLTVRQNEDATPLGLIVFGPITQGSSFLATLGFETKSLWDLEMSKLPNRDPVSRQKFSTKPYYAEENRRKRRQRRF